MNVYWVAHSLLVMLLSSLFLDWRQFKRLLPAGLTGLILCGVHLGLPRNYMPMVLSDTGPIGGNVALTLLLQLLCGPLLSMLFAQGLGTNPVTEAIRVLQFGAVSACFAWMAVQAGRISLAPWWGPGAILLTNLLWFGLVWRVHAYSAGHVQRTGAFSGMTNEPTR